MIFTNWAKITVFLLIFMISGLVLVLIIEGITTGTELLPINTAVEQVMISIRTPIMTDIFVFITRLGDPFFITFISVFIAVLLFIRQRIYDAILFITTLIIAIILLTILKNTFQIVRPTSDIITATGWSFPSGHTTVATAFFLMIIHSFLGQMKSIKSKTLLILGSILGAVLIWISRLYLGAHWMLDILAGIALGILSVSFTVLIFSVFIENRRSLKDRISS